MRGFNRFYTRQIGVLRKNFLDSPYTLGEARVLYEIGRRRLPTASDVGRALDLDAGYSEPGAAQFREERTDRAHRLGAGCTAQLSRPDHARQKNHGFAQLPFTTRRIGTCSASSERSISKG